MTGGPLELPCGGYGRQACNGHPPSPPSGAGPSISAGCGVSWAPLHTPPGYQDSSPCPGYRRHCAGQRRWHGGPSPLWKGEGIIHRDINENEPETNQDTLRKVIEESLDDQDDEEKEKTSENENKGVIQRDITVNEK